MTAVEATCGQELAQDAVVPDQLSRLFAHVAKNMEVHARWVGTASPQASREYDALRATAAAYQRIANSAAYAASFMRSLVDLPAAAHEHAQLDRQALAAWMHTKVAMQREFAQLLLDHAAASEQALAAMSAD
jgi:hypothetical protein